MAAMNSIKRILFSIVLVAPLLGLGACSVNPATGKQSFTAFMSPEKEKRVGAEEHPKIIEQFGGVYDDPDLGFYVARIGAALARHSEMPDLGFTFTVLNDETVNAFALPGGYVYITRGLLAIVSDEAEMAGVLAHEIGHVTARHTAQRYSAAMATNIGLQVLGAIGSAAGAPAGAGQLVSLGAGIALQSYSREQEMESDMLGVRYLSRAGYDPDAMTGFFHKLRAHSKLSAAMRGEKDRSETFNIMSTHPLTSERIVHAEDLAGKAAVNGRKRGLESLERAIDGMVFGDDPEQGVRRGRVFEHPGLGIRFEVPPGFTMINAPDRVTARDEEGSVIIFNMADAKKVRMAGGLEGYIRKATFGGVSFSGIEKLRINGMQAVTGAVGGERDMRLLVIRKDKNRIFQLQFRTDPSKTGEREVDFRRTTYSFTGLTPDEIAAIRPIRIGFETVRPGDTAESLARRMPLETFALEWFELLNGLKRDEPLVPGRRVRVLTR